jgi:methionine synthase II (cobalamin-independent)
MTDLPWPPGTATGVGSLPGIDPREAARLIAGELPELPHVPELPNRGAGADLIGRGAALLIDLHVDLQPAGWRLVGRPGRDERRARGWLDEDLDAVQEALDERIGPVKAQVTGPWTLAAALGLERGEPALSDPGAVRDLVDSLAEGVAQHMIELRRRLPNAGVVLQLDEPMLPAVLGGRVPTASGWGTVPAVEERTVADGLRTVLESAGGTGAVLTVVHSCAPDVPVSLLRSAGPAGISLDALLLSSADSARNEAAYEALSEALEAGTALLLGVVPSTDPGGDNGLSDTGGSVGRVERMWRRLGLAPELLARAVVLTPTCGLAGASPTWARAAMAQCRKVARRLAQQSAEQSVEQSEEQ